MATCHMALVEQLVFHVSVCTKVTTLPHLPGIEQRLRVTYPCYTSKLDYILYDIYNTL